MRAKRLLPVLLGVALLAAGAPGCLGDSGVQGKEAPDFSVETLRGEEVALSDFEDRVVVVDFMSSMCGYCYANGRALKGILKEHPDAVVVSVNMGETATNYVTREGASLEEYRSTIGVTREEYPNWYFGKEVKGVSKKELADRYSVRATPALFLVGPDGTVRDRQGGVINEMYGEKLAEAEGR